MSMRHLLGRKAVLLGLAAALLLGGCAGGAPPPSMPSPVLGEPLPRIQRRALDGSTVSTREASGKMVVVKFYADYCEPCKKTLPAIEALHRQRPEVLFIGIAEDEYRSEAEAVVARYRLSFPVVHDAGNALAGRFRVTELPVTFVADREGVIRWVGGSKQGEGDVEAVLNALGR